MTQIAIPLHLADAPPEMIEAGMYMAEITGASIEQVQKEGSATFGSTMIKWEFTINDPNKPKYNGRKLFHRSNLNDTAKLADGTQDHDKIKKGLYFLKQFMDTVGAPYDADGLDTDRALGCKAVIRVENGEYNGRPTANIAQVLKAV